MVDSFRAKDVLKAPVAMRGGGCSSGVSSVVMYNAGPKHALVALLPRSCSGGFDALGSGARRGRIRTGSSSDVGVSAFTSDDLPWGDGATADDDGGNGRSSSDESGDGEPLRRVRDMAPPHSPIRNTAAPQKPGVRQGIVPGPEPGAAALRRRSFKRDIDRLTEIANDMAEFPTRDGGGVRVEAHLVEGCPGPGSFIRAMKDGILAARFMGDSSKSGCRCTAVIEKQTADRFNGLMTKFATRQIQGSGGRERDLIQGTVNQLGYHCLTHSISRDYFWESAPWKKLFLSAMRNNDTAMRQQSGSRRQSESSSSSSSSTGNNACAGVVAPRAAPPPPAARGSDGDASAICDLMRWGEGSWGKAALIPGFGEWEKEEELSDLLAQNHFVVANGAVVKVNSPVNRFGPIAQDHVDTYMGVAPSPHGPKAVLAIGSYAVCAFAVDLIAAFLCVANEECTFLSEKYLRQFGFKRGEGSSRPFRIPKVKRDAVTAAALALVQSPVARVLVWPHFAGTNAAIAKAKSLLPCEKGGLSEAKLAFVALQKEAAVDWRAFRAGMISFVRARHQAMCRGGNRATGLAAGEPHPFFAAKKDPPRKSAETAAAAVAVAAGEAGEAGGAAAAAAKAGGDAAAGGAAAAAAGGVPAEATALLCSSSSSSSSGAAPGRYTTFSKAILSNTRAPFEISLTNLLRKINTALETSGIGYEECEALSHLRQMEIYGLGVSVGKHGKVLRI